MPYFLSPIGNSQIIDANGDPLVGGTIETYLAGTSTPATTYTDDTGGTAQGVVMTLNSLGLPTLGPVWMLGGVPLKFVIKNALGVVQPPTYDDISGIGDTSTTPDQFPFIAPTPTYISATSFSLAGDQTNDAQIGRRIRSVNTGGTIYSSITNRVFGAGITTVTVVNDSGVLDSGLSQVNYALLTPLNPSVPSTYAKSGANTDITSLGNNTSTIYTTGGTSTAYTITPTPTYSAYAAGMSFVVNFNAASGAAPTLAINGIATPPNLVKRNTDGTFSNLAAGDFPINHRSRVTLISATQAWVESMPGGVILATPVASTSGTSIDFTAIPAGVKRITVMFSAVSTSGTSIPIVQLGDSGGVETSGYAGVITSVNSGGSAGIESYSVGFFLNRSATAADVFHGTLVLNLLNPTTNTWVASGVIALSSSNFSNYVAGSKSLSATLDRIRITTVAGADTFDAGVVNISYE